MEKILDRVIREANKDRNEICAVSDCNEKATHYVSFGDGMGVFTCEKHRRMV